MLKLWLVPQCMNHGAIAESTLTLKYDTGGWLNPSEKGELFGENQIACL